MTWRTRIRHDSRYVYDGEVRASYNEARITPLTTVDQLVLEATVEVDPPARMFRYLDYWGSVVHAFNLDVAHRALHVTGRSVVETTEPVPPELVTSWDALDNDGVRDDWAELLAPTPTVPTDPQLTEVAEQLRASTSPDRAGALIVDWVRDQLTYARGRTGVHTSAIEAWTGGSGVCQDFAHLTLALARAMGIPGRYCSGYLHPDPDAEVGSVVEGESHAWVELWAGDWHGLDPTTGWPVGERHVLVARGRDYQDVPPLKGVFHGGPTSRMEVSVQLSRVA
jgi:transglutaminase-like putative cysteine protease